MNHLAIVFPGQGSQSLGMLAGLADKYSEVKATYAEASTVLGYDLWSLVQAGPLEKLNETVHTQPALLAGAYAVWRILQAQKPVQPAILAGHSLGEYTALVCAKALAFQDAVRIVAARGQYMQEAVAPGIGAMAAIIGLEEDAVAKICQNAITSSNEVVSSANFNSTGQIVIAGHKTAVDRAIILAKEQGAKLVMLIPVSVPSHCKLMEPAAKNLENLLSSVNLQEPKIPVLGNADVKLYTTPDSIREGLVRQLYAPVRWVETIQYFIAQGISHIIECGPGKILTGLNKRIDQKLQLSTTADLASLETLLNSESEKNL